MPPESTGSTKRAEWSRYGFILAAIGSAVGLGNIWRFPYVVGENGGGAFLIPYIISFLCFGIPLMILEFTVGRGFRGSVVTAFGRLHPRLRHLGLLPFVMVIVVFSYYSVIAGWTLAYVLFSVTGYMDFETFTSSPLPLVTFFATILLAGSVVKVDLKAGIERANRYLMPVLGLALLVMLVQALTLPGVQAGLTYYLTPDLSVLSDPGIWVQAAGQVFFSLSIGFGVLLTYGSYLSDTESIPRSAVLIAGADFLVALIAGFIIFPVVFSFGFDPVSGPQLAFITLPEIFSTMAFGSFFGALFFILLFVGALSSILSMVEGGVATIVDEWAWPREKATLLVCILAAIIGLPSALSYAGFDITLFGAPFLDSVDLLFGILLVPVSASVICIAFSWLWKPESLLAEVNKNSRFKFPRAAVTYLRYVVPVLLFVTLASTVAGML
ncbi:NSS family neurotransmitter:Na+ symporter [Methanofollis sp. W23]|uniref:sodium-dependent transporter n=1 Tax=Methanofollis sp. W23 TaxID=2817849 RepID=UPI001AEB007B|nr:sodium-dependent transporter [Methanofollis sp. W23]MBP2145299.1 NSS family neurotransmitter:Na+ symporter [Methanofollis sp. W23]